MSTLTTLTFQMFYGFIMKNYTVLPVDKEIALFEINLLKNIGITAEMETKEMEYLYLTKCRVGAMHRMNRADRKCLMLSFQNAINHASVNLEVIEQQREEKLLNQMTQNLG